MTVISKLDSLSVRRRAFLPCTEQRLITVYLVFYLISCANHAATGGASPTYAVYYIVAYAVCILAAIIYELISTKRWKNLKSIIPTVGIALLLNIVFGLSLFAVYHTGVSHMNKG